MRWKIQSVGDAINCQRQNDPPRFKAAGHFVVFKGFYTFDTTPLCRKNSARSRTGFPVMRAMASP